MLLVIQGISKSGQKCPVSDVHHRNFSCPLIRATFPIRPPSPPSSYTRAGTHVWGDRSWRSAWVCSHNPCPNIRSIRAWGVGAPIGGVSRRPQPATTPNRTSPGPGSMRPGADRAAGQMLGAYVAYPMHPCTHASIANLPLSTCDPGRPSPHCLKYHLHYAD